MTAAATLHNLNAIAARHGLPLPTAFTTAADTLASRYAPPTVHRDDLAAAVADCTADGRDPFTDDAVRTILLRRAHGHAVADALRTAHENALDTLLREHAPAILEGWRDRWAELGAVVTGAAQALPGVDFEKPGGVAHVGTDPASLARWGEGHAAVTELEAIASAVALFLTPSPADLGALIGAPLTASEYDQLAALARHRQPWAPALIGVPLDLATDKETTFYARAAALAADRARADAARRPRLVNLLTGATI